MWRPDVSLEAELEIFEAALRDQRERAALGFRFEAQVNTVFARLLENPFQFPTVEEEARRALTQLHVPFECANRVDLGPTVAQVASAF